MKYINNTAIKNDIQLKMIIKFITNTFKELRNNSWIKVVVV